MKDMQHKLANIATKNTANKTSQQKMEGEIKTLKSDIKTEFRNYIMLNALMTSMTERVGELGSLQTEFQNIKKLDYRIEEVAKVTERLEKKAVNQDLAKEVATFTKRLVSLEEDMAQQASKLKPDTYYEGLVTRFVAAITQRQVENLQTEVTNLTAGIDAKLNKLKQESNNHSSVLSMFFDFSLSLANPDISHRDANIWLDFLYKDELYKIVPNHSGLNLRDFCKTQLHISF